MRHRSTSLISDIDTQNSLNDQERQDLDELGETLQLLESHSLYKLTPEILQTLKGKLNSTNGFQTRGIIKNILGANGEYYPPIYALPETSENTTLRVSSPTVITEERSTLLHKIEVFPNPTEGKVIFRIPSIMDYTDLKIKVFDSLGTLIGETFSNDPSINTLFLDIRGNPTGIFFYQIMDGNKMLDSGKIIKER